MLIFVCPQTPCKPKEEHKLEATATLSPENHSLTHQDSIIGFDTLYGDLYHYQQCVKIKLLKK